ncbi:anaerobic ribonucleoside-triphosphate reductase activating protein [Novisyntrophococcus fermenticellae]|uniref:anaerobic ribonucleoside-triphosphate reductase activating protein n=1 Tax=Novisyntrophococcus fermenticellae TaxID=2068655 RepID=UPI001E3FABA3|nr:anaerobic ribonucleoside-triphosphate reductase activating protein [Novisyntrophococcus fermenticellae]
MRYHNITKDDMKNGEGLRVVLWVSGCSHHCEGCQNPITWDPECGLNFDGEAKEEIFEQLQQDYISGITFSGGDPLFPGNREEVYLLSKAVKARYPDKTIWLYTGYLWEEIQHEPIINYLDVVVDGRYMESERNVTLPWKGSSNQRVIDVPKTIQLGQVVLYAEETNV